MIQIKLNGHYLEMYDSIDNLPITRFQEYNRLAMLDAGIGGDLQSINEHVTTVLRHYQKGEGQKMKQELENMRQNMMFVVNKTSPRMKCFIPLIKSINGKLLTDISDTEGISRDLSNKGLTIGKVNGFLITVKKKLSSKWRPFSLRWSTIQSPWKDTPN